MLSKISILNLQWCKKEHNKSTRFYVHNDHNDHKIKSSTRLYDYTNHNLKKEYNKSSTRLLDYTNYKFKKNKY